MTLILETESHGKVESGFYSGFTQLARIGKYTLATKHLCNLAKNLAEQTTLKESRILVYDLDKFWQREREFTQELIGRWIEHKQPYSTESENFDIKKQLEKEQGEVLLEDDIDIFNEGRMIPIKVGDDERLVTIGKYIIDAPNFGGMIIYLAKGGIFGWVNNQEPEFAKPTLEAIMNSERKLYRGIRAEL